MLRLLLLVALTATWCDASSRFTQWLEEAADVTAELDSIVHVKLEKALHSLRYDSSPLLLRRITRIQRLAGNSDLLIEAAADSASGTHINCAIILHEEPPTDNQRIYIACGDRRWQVTRGTPRYDHSAGYMLTLDDARTLDEKVAKGLEHLQSQRTGLVDATVGNVVSVAKEERENGTMFVVRLLVGIPPRPCVVELLERIGADDEFTLICRGLRLETSLPPIARLGEAKA